MEPLEQSFYAKQILQTNHLCNKCIECLENWKYQYYLQDLTIKTIRHGKTYSQGGYNFFVLPSNVKNVFISGRQFNFNLSI